MTKKDKNLLLKDLCARLPYGVIVHATIDGDNTLLGIYNDRVLTTCEEHGKHNDYPLECIKPYLRPMSSMTDEEKKELGNFVAASMFASQNKDPLIQLAEEALYGEFFNKHHFDYRRLIPTGLALEAPEGLYKTE